jgi:hypothetical protein
MEMFVIDKFKILAPVVAISVALAFSAVPVLAAGSSSHTGQSVQLAQASTDAPQKKKKGGKKAKKSKKKKMQG